MPQSNEEKLLDKWHDLVAEMGKIVLDGTHLSKTYDDYYHNSVGMMDVEEFVSEQAAKDAKKFLRLMGDLKFTTAYHNAKVFVEEQWPSGMSYSGGGEAMDVDDFQAGTNAGPHHSHCTPPQNKRR